MAKGKAMRIDFSGVEQEIRKGGGGRVHVPEGDYRFKILDSKRDESERSGKPYLLWTCQFVDGQAKGKKLYTRTFLNPEALWNLRNLIHAALGKNVAGKAVNFNPEQLYGKVVGASVEDNEYKGKLSSQIVTFFPADEVEVSDDDEEETEDETEEEEEEEEEEDEDLEDVDLEEL